MSNVEQAKYTVIMNEDPFEVRLYAPAVIAETEIEGERKDAIGQGFSAIADYIFGNNQSEDSVAMTAPVLQQAGAKIAMTAPVSQEGRDTSWKVRFVIPSAYTLDTLPKPNNPKVHLMQVPGKTMVVIGFSGLADDDLLHQKQAELQNFMHENHMTAIGSPLYAFYNPPWTLPFLRHNEVMFEIVSEEKKDKSTGSSPSTAPLKKTGP